MINPTELLLPTLNGNIIIINVENLRRAVDFSLNAELKQFSVSEQTDGSYVLSTPCTNDFEDQFPGIVHGAKARAKEAEKPKPKPPTGGPDGTPPQGGTPGSTRQVEFINTEAIAA